MTLSINENTSTLELIAGVDDDQAGIRISVDGDAYPRTVLLPDGTVLKGDGTAAPAVAGIGEYISLSVTSLDTPDDGTIVSVEYDTVLHDSDYFSFDETGGIVTTVNQAGTYAVRTWCQVGFGSTEAVVSVGIEANGGSFWFAEDIGVTCKKLMVTDFFVLDAGDTIDSYVGAAVVGSTVNVITTIIKIA